MKRFQIITHRPWSLNKMCNVSNQSQRLPRLRVSSSVPVSILALSAMLMLCTQAANAATTFYVSKTGNNQDGLSYATAWNELAQIKWKNIPAGSVIKIDGGGANGMIYNTSLIDDVTNYANGSASGITIESSPDAGHNGHIAIDGQRNVNYSRYGIYLNGVSNVTIVGPIGNPLIQQTSIGGLEVRNQASVGVQVSNCTSCNLELLEVDHNFTSGGLVASNNQNLSLNGCLIHDNSSANAGQGSVLPGAYGSANNPQNISANQNTGLSFFDCWIYNSTPTQYYLNGSLLTPGGAQLNGGSSNFQFCAFGPYVDSNFVNSTATYTQALFVQPNANALNVQSARNSLTLQDCTSFIPSGANSTGVYPAFINAGPPSLGNTIKIFGSTIYGGAISAPAGSNFSAGYVGSNTNWQFNTTGNTQALGSNIGNPVTQQPFVTNVSGLTNGLNPPSYTYNSPQTYRPISFYGKSGSPVPVGNTWSEQTINNLLTGVFAAGG